MVNTLAGLERMKYQKQFNNCRFTNKYKIEDNPPLVSISTVKQKQMKTLIDELVILDDCVVTGTFKWRSEIDSNWKPMVWNETFECWTKDYCG